MSEATKIVVCCGGCDPKCGNCFVPTEVALTAEEIAQNEANAITWAAEEAAKTAAAEALAALKASAKAKLIAGTPLTEAEATTIVL